MSRGAPLQRRRGGWRFVVAGLVLGAAVTVISLALASVLPALSGPTVAVRASPSQSQPRVDPTAPPFHPGGDAPANFDYFNYLNLSLILSRPKPSVADFVNGLVAGGFDRAAISFTTDITSVGLASDSFQFAVHIGGQCLIGQFGSGSGGYRSMVAPELVGVGCLVGAGVQAAR